MNISRATFAAAGEFPPRQRVGQDKGPLIWGGSPGNRAGRVARDLQPPTYTPAIRGQRLESPAPGAPFPIPAPETPLPLARAFQPAPPLRSAPSPAPPAPPWLLLSSHSPHAVVSLRTGVGGGREAAAARPLPWPELRPLARPEPQLAAAGQPRPLPAL